MQHPPWPHWLLKDGNHYPKVQSHFNWIVGLPIHYMLQRCHSLAGGSNGGKRNTRRGVYTQETATTKGKRWDEKWQQTSSCRPCRSYMGSTACSSKSAMIIHTVAGKQIDLKKRKTTNKYLLLFLSSLNYAYHLNSDQLHACLYPWDLSYSFYRDP